MIDWFPVQNEIEKKKEKRWSALSTRVWHQSVGLFVFRSFSYGMAFEIVPLRMHSIQIEITNKNYFEHKSLLLVICTGNEISELQGFLWVIFHTSLSEACIHLWDRKIIDVSSIIFHFIRSFITCAEVFFSLHDIQTIKILCEVFSSISFVWFSILENKFSHTKMYWGI